MPMLPAGLPHAALPSEVDAVQWAKHHMDLALWASDQRIWEWDRTSNRITVRCLEGDEQRPPVDDGEAEAVLAQAHPDDRPGIAQAWARHLRGIHADLDLIFRVGEGDSLRWVQMRGRALGLDANGRVQQTVGTVKDITAEHHLQESQRLMAHAFACTRDALVLVDSDCRVLEVNESALHLIGIDAGVMPGVDLRQWLEVNPVQLQSVRRDGLWMGECQLLTGDGPVPVELAITAVADATSGRQPQSFLLELVDLRERRENEQRLERLAMFDTLTGLPNRLGLQVHVERALHGMQPAFGLLLINLDGFKEVNDSYGHDTGDGLLQGVALRLTANLPEGTLLARQGADEFVVVLPPDSGDTDVRGVAQLVLATLARRFKVGDEQISVTPTMGAVLVPQDGLDFQLLMRRADAALQDGKARGRNGLTFYDDSLESDAQRRVRLVSILREDTERNAFNFVAQPKVDPNGRPLGAEILIRWSPPSVGPVSPVEFIPLAEKVGLIPMIGRHAMHAAAQLVSECQRVGHALPVAVNLSPKQLLQPGLDAQLLNACRRHGIEPAMLELELTESALVHSMDIVQPLLTRLRSQGFSLSLDDFGTGYSSLSYLRHLPFQKVKIDRSFVMDVDRDPKAVCLLESIVHLCGSLGMKTVAEGVETVQQLDILRSLGVTEYQGYWFSRPMPVADWVDLLAAAPGDALVLPRP